MRISIMPIIRKDKIKKDSTAPIYIRVTKNRKSRFIGTGVTILINNWGGENKLVKQGLREYTPKDINRIFPQTSQTTTPLRSISAKETE